MLVTRILTYVFLIVSIGLAVYLVNIIRDKIMEEERIERMESRIINKLKMIREAQIAYRSAKGKYTSDWDSLIGFVDSGYIYITNRKETVITLDYGADSVYIEIDTIGRVSVRDSLFNNKRYPNFELGKLPIIPGTEGEKFVIWADKIEKSGVMVDVIEVKNTIPVDPERKESNESNTKKPLRFGSRTNVTTAGNWE